VSSPVAYLSASDCHIAIVQLSSYRGKMACCIKHSLNILFLSLLTSLSISEFYKLSFRCFEDGNIMYELIVNCVMHSKVVSV
jgi:hypothetical protein